MSLTLNLLPRAKSYSPINSSSESFSKSHHHPRYILSQNNTQIKKNKSGSGSAFLCNTVKKNVHKWTFKLLKVNPMITIMTIGIWKANKPINTKYGLHEKELRGKCYGWTVNSQNLIYGDGDTEEKYGGKECATGDIIEMILDLNKCQLRYTRNGQNYNIAYKNIQSTAYRAVISTHAPGDAIELISYSKVKTDGAVADIHHNATNYARCGFCDKLKDITRELKRDKDKLMKHVAELEQQVEILQQEEVILKSERQTFRQKSTLSIKDKELLEMECKELKDKTESLEEDVMAKDMMIETLEKEKMKLMEIIDGQKEECKELREELEEIRVKYEELRVKSIDESEYMQWDYQQIADWILSLDEEYKTYEESLRENLKKESVDGSVLGLLSRSDLHRFGIENIKHKIAIEEQMQRIAVKGKKDNDEGIGLIDDTAYLYNN